MFFYTWPNVASVLIFSQPEMSFPFESQTSVRSQKTAHDNVPASLNKKSCRGHQELKNQRKKKKNGLKFHYAKLTFFLIGTTTGK